MAQLVSLVLQHRVYDVGRRVQQQRQLLFTHTPCQNLFLSAIALPNAAASTHDVLDWTDLVHGMLPSVLYVIAAALIEPRAQAQKLIRIAPRRDDKPEFHSASKTALYAQTH